MKNIKIIQLETGAMNDRIKAASQRQWGSFLIWFLEVFLGSTPLVLRLLNEWRKDRLVDQLDQIRVLGDQEIYFLSLITLATTLADFVREENGRPLTVIRIFLLFGQMFLLIIAAGLAGAIGGDIPNQQSYDLGVVLLVISAILCITIQIRLIK